MAINLEDKENVQAPDSDYPYGKIKDDTGAGDGTPVNVEVYGDFHQFFAKMFALSGLTYNGLPDNDYSGFQYIEAANKNWKNFTGVLQIDSSTVLTEADRGKLINVFLATGDITVTLPSISSINEGDNFCIMNNGNYKVTINRSSIPDSIRVSGGASSNYVLYSPLDFANFVTKKSTTEWFLAQSVQTVPKPKSVIVYKAGSIGTIASATLKADTVISDDDSLYDSATGRFTPGLVGFYNFSMNLQIEIAAALSGFTTQVLVNKNGTPYIYLASSPYEGGGFSGLLHLSGILECTNVSDYFTFEYGQSSSQSTTITMSKTFNYIKQ